MLWERTLHTNANRRGVVCIPLHRSFPKFLTVASPGPSARRASRPGAAARGAGGAGWLGSGGVPLGNRADPRASPRGPRRVVRGGGGPDRSPAAALLPLEAEVTST